MKTSKKLLSLFLAVVMVVTSCSVGFTAFAADGNKTDKNAAYWNNNTEAEEAFNAVTDLVNNYVPVLANGALKSLLESTGMTVNENTSLQDIVAGVSPALMKLLAVKGNKEQIITDFYQEKGYSEDEAKNMYKKFSSFGLYDYLDDEDATMDFYALYQFCLDNQDSSNSEKKDFATTNLPKLKALLQKHLDAYNSLKSENGGDDVTGTAKLKEYKETVKDGGIHFNEDLTLYELENFEISGTKLKDVHKTDKSCNTKIAYDNMFLDFDGAPFQIDNIAAALFYQYNEKYVKGIFYLYLARLGGATVKYNGETLTPSNYKTVIGDADKTFEDYCTDRSLDPEDSESRKIYDSYCDSYRLNEVYNTIFDGSTVASEIDGTGEFASPYYSAIALGALEATKSYDTEAYSSAKNYVKDQMVKDDEIKALYQFINNGGTFDGYIDSDSCAFSSPVRKFYKDWLSGSYFSMMIDYNIQNCSSESAAVTLFKKIGLEDKYEQSGGFWDSDCEEVMIQYFDKTYPSDESVPIYDITEFLLPSVIIQQLQNRTDGAFGFPGTANVKFFYEDMNIGKLVKGLMGSDAYDYDNYKIPDSLAVDVVNDTINGYLSYLEPGTDIGNLVSDLLGKLLTSNIDLSTSLKDIWKNLYNEPVETVFNLLPILVILVDEVLIPMVFNDNSAEDSALYGILITGIGEGGGIEALKNLSQASGNTSVGIGNLAFDLNKVVPSILNWLLGNDDAAREIVGTYGSYADGVDTSVPVFTNIYVADKALAGARLNGGLAKTLKNGALSDKPEIADSIDEALTEIASFALDAINDYLAKCKNDPRYNANGDVAQKGLNNIFVALPQVLDIMGKNFVKKYNVKSDWTLSYKIKTISGEKHNTVLDGFKALATENNPTAVLEYFVNTLIGEWINPIIDIVNDTIQDENNKISSNLSIVQSLLEALGGFGEKSIITDVVNGLFQLKRNDAATFTLKKRDNGFVGFSTESGMFLLSNILYKTDSGKTKGLIPFITTLIKKDGGSAKYKLSNIYKSSAPLLASSSKAKKSSVGTKYSELLSKENKKAAKKLVGALDTLLASLLENTSLNGFDLDKTDNIINAVATVASSYFGAKNTNDLVKLINNYFYYVVGETNKRPGEYGKIGIRPKNGNVDKKKVYTSANLSNLVIQTYSLIENIIDYLFYNKDSGFLKDRDPNMLLADAAYGLVSPDAVAIRMSSKYSKTKNILLENSRKNWNSFKVQINAVNRDNGTYYTKDYLKFGFSKGNKKAFYNALGQSLSGVAGIIGAILTASYTNSTKKDNYYSKLVYPVFNSVNTALGAGGVMTPAEFNKASAPNKLIKGLITPISSALDTLYDAPATFILNFVKGVSGVLDDSSIKSFVKAATDPIQFLIKGAAKVVNNLSPTLAGIISSVAPKITLSGKLPEKNIVVSLLNSISFVQKLATIPNINWKKLAAAKTPEEVLLLVYGFVVDFLLSNEKLQKIIDSLSPEITKILKKLSAAEILRLFTEVLAVVQSPTEIYWTFSEYANKLTNSFIYPRGVLASEASNAVYQLDDLVENVFPLLNALGVTDIKGLYPIINDKLYTNDLLTKIAKGLYGALSKGTVAKVLSAVSMDVSPKGYAKYLTDKSYGKTFSSAAATLRKAKSWDKVESLNWGFTDGSSKAQTGFVNGLAAVLRPLNNVLAVLLAEGKLDSDKLDIEGIIKTLSLQGSTEYGNGSEYGGTLTYKLKNGTFTLTVRSNAITNKDKRTATNVLTVDVEKIVKDFEALFSDANFGTNGYESAVVPILEAFMCKNVKTYKQYKKDYKKAKDNLLIDVLNPVLGLVKDIANNPFYTVTKILPNVAYFIDNNGVSQAIGNLLAPITSKNGILGVLKKNGIDVDKLIKNLTGKKLGKIVTDALGLKKVKLNIELNNLAATNVQDLVVPLVQKLLKDKLGLTLPTFKFKTIASHGTLRIVSSKAKNNGGKYTTRRVIARQGEVLVAVLRYVSDVLITNAKPIRDLITGIDGLKDKDTIKNIISCVFNQMATAAKDDIVRAVFYFLTERSTDSFFDYRDFKYKKGYKFSFGNMDEDFCRQLAPMLDGLVGGLLEGGLGGLGGLVEEKLYTDNLVAKLAKGLYGAIEGVNINDNIGSLTNLLAMTDIDFSASNVANLLTNERYGMTYPAVADVIRSAGSWENVNADDLKFGVKDRNSFMNALAAVLRPIYGVLDVLLNDASLNIFDLVKIPGSDGYTSTIVPLLEAFGVYNIKTQYQYREDCYEAYDNILLDIINPLWDKVEDILNAPVEMLADILPNLSLFFANDGLLQIVDNLFTPISALLEAIRPIVDINAILKAAGLDIPKLLNEKVGLNVPKFDLYDLPGTLKPLVGADNVVDTLNGILAAIKIKDTPLGIVLPQIDWFRLASHGKFVPKATSQVATYGGRIAVVADQDETLIAVLRFVIDTINYKDNYDAIVNLITGLLGDNVSASISDVISQVLGMLKGDSDEVIEQLVDLLKQFA